MRTAPILHSYIEPRGAAPNPASIQTKSRFYDPGLVAGGRWISCSGRGAGFNVRQPKPWLVPHGQPLFDDRSADPLVPARHRISVWVQRRASR